MSINIVYDGIMKYKVSYIQKVEETKCAPI